MKKVISGVMLAGAVTFVWQDKIERSEVSVVKIQNITDNYVVKNFSSGRSRANGNRVGGKVMESQQSCSAVMTLLNGLLGLQKCNS